MPEPVHPLDRDGEWEFAITIRRNGRRVAICDFLTSEFDDGAHIAATLLQRRDVTLTGAAARWDSEPRVSEETD